jgi:signal transduction histidine kinase/CheY-like chemotaxis protein
LIVASLSIPAVLLAGAVVKNRFDVQRDADDAIVRTVNVLHEHARKVFETEELALARVDDRIEGLNWDQISAPETSAFLARLKRPLEQAVSIWVADATGEVRAGSQDWDHSIKIEGREFFTAQQQEDAGFHVSAAFFGKATHSASFAVSRRRSTPTGAFDGTIHISLSPSYFARFFQQAAPDLPRYTALLLRADGEVLVREPEDLANAHINATSPIMRQIAAQPEGGLLKAASDRDGVERMMAYRKVEGYPVYVLLGVETSAVLEDWHDNVVIFSMVAAAAAITLALMAGLALRDARARDRATTGMKAAFAATSREVARREVAEQRLHEAQKLEALGHLAGGIAHDFNNVLQGVMSGAHLIARRSGNPAQVVKLTEMLVGAAERGIAITGRLTTLARRGSLRAEPVDTASLLSAMREVLEHTLGGSVRVRTDAEGCPALLVDRGQLETVLVNLAVNARDAMKNGGTISLAGRAERIAPGQSHPTGLPPGDYVRLAVSDDGGGMDEATLMRAADPFFTTKPRGEGSGLGLSMADGFASQSGGAMTVRSTLGQGTIVTLWLPQATLPDPVAASDSVEPGDVSGLSGVLAVVDDEPYVREVLAAELSDLNHQVSAFAGGHAALAWLAGSSTRLDLLVTDLAMPGMNGLMLIKAARVHRPGLAALLVTGHQEDASDSVLREVRESGPFAVLVKPVTRRQLALQVDALLAVQGAVARLEPQPGD